MRNLDIDRMHDLDDRLDLDDRHFERAHTDAEALLCHLFALLDAGDIRASLRLIDAYLGVGSRA